MVLGTNNAENPIASGQGPSPEDDMLLEEDNERPAV